MMGPKYPGRQIVQICDLGRRLLLTLLISTTLSACLPASPAVPGVIQAELTPNAPGSKTATSTQSRERIVTSIPETVRPDPTSSPPPSPTRLPEATSKPTLTGEPAAEICSPLEAIPLEALLEIISNPYEPSRTGKDDGHPALDLAFYHWRGLADIAGHPVQSVMPGSVAALGFNRLPYGNMVIIETPWEGAPSSARRLPGAAAGGSFYVLYAHLQDAPELTLGETVSCGQPLGRAGQTGRSGAPHLHLEVRFGPEGAQFSPMVFYDTQATAEQMESYRLWTMSGVFASVEPLALLGLLEIQ